MEVSGTVEVPLSSIFSINPGFFSFLLNRTYFVLFFTTAMVALTTAEVVPLVVAAFIVADLFILFRCVKMPQAKEAVNGEVLLLIACAFTLGVALEDTGVASTIANGLLGVLTKGGKFTILLGIYILTALLSSVISNAATVALMFPIAYQFVETAGISEKAVIYTLMIAGSSCFTTPIGYQTNLMVMGPGGYNFVDYFKIGFPLTLVLMLSTVALASFIYV